VATGAAVVGAAGVLEVAGASVEDASGSTVMKTPPGVVGAGVSAGEALELDSGEAVADGTETEPEAAPLNAMTSAGGSAALL
jgi:hypothetical protein